MNKICLREIKKSYAGRPVLDGFTLVLPQGSRTCLMAPSGSGKTTLFRLILGLERPDGGEITGTDGCRMGAVFQEDRLLEELTAVENVRLVTAKPVSDREIRSHLLRVLPEEALDKPAGKQSGGMKRRIALVRAVLSPADVLVLDEPFAGLDSATKEQVIRYLLEEQKGRTLLFSTHQEEDARLMQADVCGLNAAADEVKSV